MEADSDRNPRTPLNDQSFSPIGTFEELPDGSIVAYLDEPPIKEEHGK